MGDRGETRSTGEGGATLSSPQHDVMDDAGQRSRAKGGTEGSGRIVEGVGAPLAGRGDRANIIR